LYSNPDQIGAIVLWTLHSGPPESQIHRHRLLSHHWSC